MALKHNPNEPTISLTTKKNPDEPIFKDFNHFCGLPKEPLTHEDYERLDQIPFEPGQNYENIIRNQSIPYPDSRKHQFQPIYDII